MSNVNMPQEHRDLVIAALSMKSSIAEKRDLDRMRIDRLTMLKKKAIETYTDFSQMEDTINTLMDIADFLTGRNG